MKKRLSIVAAGSLVLALAACGGGSGAGNAGGGSASGSGDGAKPTKIKLVAAEYSKDNTKAFWDAFAKTYKEKYCLLYTSRCV